MSNKNVPLNLTDNYEKFLKYNDTSDFYHYNQDDEYLTIESDDTMLAPKNMNIITDKNDLKKGPTKVNTKDVGQFTGDLGMEFEYGQKVDTLSYQKYDGVIANVDINKPLITNISALRASESRREKVANGDSARPSVSAAESIKNFSQGSYAMNPVTGEIIDLSKFLKI
jgi:hypothetical protein